MTRDEERRTKGKGPRTNVEGQRTKDEGRWKTEEERRPKQKTKDDGGRKRTIDEGRRAMDGRRRRQVAGGRTTNEEERIRVHVQNARKQGCSHKLKLTPQRTAMTRNASTPSNAKRNTKTEATVGKRESNRASSRRTRSTAKHAKRRDDLTNRTMTRIAYTRRCGKAKKVKS